MAIVGVREAVHRAGAEQLTPPDLTPALRRIAAQVAKIASAFKRQQSRGLCPGHIRLPLFFCSHL